MDNSFEKMTSYLQIVIDDINSSDPQAGVIDVDRDHLDKCSEKINEAVSYLRKTSRKQAPKLIRLERLWSKLYEVLLEAWDIPAMRRLTIQLQSLLKELEPLCNEKPVESVERFEYFLKGKTVYQLASEARELYLSGQYEKSKALFDEALTTCFLCPYESYRMRATIELFTELNKSGDIDLISSFIKKIDLDRSKYRDIAVWTLIQKCGFDQIKQAVEWVKLILSQESRSMAYEFLFQESVERDVKIAHKLISKMRSRAIRYRSLALLSQSLCKKSFEGKKEENLNQAQELIDQIADEKIKKKAQAFLDHTIWQQYVRYERESLPDRKIFRALLSAQEKN